MTEMNTTESGIAVENIRTVTVGALKASNSVKVTLDKTAMYTIAQVIEMAKFAVPESVRTENGVIESTALLPDNCKMIALGVTNVKAGWEDDEYDDEDEEDEEDEEDDDDDFEASEDSYTNPEEEGDVVNEDVPCEFRRCIKVGSLKASNSRTITLDKRSMYTVAQVIEAAGFAVPESVRTENGLIETSALLPDSCKMIALGLTNVKAGSDEVPSEFKRCIKVGSLKASNSVTVTLDKRTMYTVAMVIEKAGFAVPESVRTENGIIEAGALLPDNVKQIALGLTNVKAGSSTF